MSVFIQNQNFLNKLKAFQLGDILIRNVFFVLSNQFDKANLLTLVEQAKKAAEAAGDLQLLHPFV
jgi:hypothetical protein